MYKRVLVATGGSPWSDAAVAYAIAWAACTGAELRILTVLASPVTYTMPDVMSSSELLMESIERQGQELLDRVAAQAERAGIGSPLREGPSRFRIWLRFSDNHTRRCSWTGGDNCKTIWTKRRVSKIAK